MFTWLNLSKLSCFRKVGSSGRRELTSRWGIEVELGAPRHQTVHTIGSRLS